MVGVSFMDCPAGHKGILVPHRYLDDSREFVTTVCELCKSVLDSKFGIPCTVSWESQLEFLTIYYKRKSLYDKAKDNLTNILPKKSGRKPKLNGIEPVVVGLDKLKRLLRNNRFVLGDDKTINLMRLLLEFEEVLRG